MQITLACKVTSQTRYFPFHFKNDFINMGRKNGLRDSGKWKFVILKQNSLFARINFKKKIKISIFILSIEPEKFS